jgi:hypothetical protein
MPKSKLRSNHGGHALTKGKGSVYKRSYLKRIDQRELKAYLVEQATSTGMESWAFPA